jgi:mannose-6-phosphate isomerase-like protein (cupin superfamily)
MIHEERPWGSYTVLHTDSKYQVKELLVNSGMRLSLQSHKFRSEHWFIVSGSGLIQLDEKHIVVEQGDAVDVPIGVKHRIACTSDQPLVFIEVQTGISFDESDITRHDDDFGRTTN